MKSKLEILSKPLVTVGDVLELLGSKICKFCTSSVGRISTRGGVSVRQSSRWRLQKPRGFETSMKVSKPSYLYRYGRLCIGVSESFCSQVYSGELRRGRDDIFVETKDPSDPKIKVAFFSGFLVSAISPVNLKPKERKEYVIEEAVPNDPGANAPKANKDKLKHMDDMLDVDCLMLATMTLELQKQHEDMVAYEMIQNLNEIYEGQARQERYETSKALFQCKMSEGSPVGAHVIKMMGYIQTLEKLGFALNDELSIDVVLQSLPDSFNQFVLNFNMNEINKTLPQLLGMLRTAEGKVALKPKGGVSKDGKCFHCDKPRHWKRNCPIYLEDVKKANVVGASVSEGLHMRRNLAKGDVSGEWSKSCCISCRNLCFIFT
ncbi:hypothetical protein V6N13_032088 [Hibiscus sabdariffa]